MPRALCSAYTSHGSSSSTHTLHRTTALLHNNKANNLFMYARSEALHPTQAPDLDTALVRSNWFRTKYLSRLRDKYAFVNTCNQHTLPAHVHIPLVRGHSQYTTAMILRDEHDDSDGDEDDAYDGKPLELSLIHI